MMQTCISEKESPPVAPSPPVPAMHEDDFPPIGEAPFGRLITPRGLWRSLPRTSLLLLLALALWVFWQGSKQQPPPPPDVRPTLARTLQALRETTFSNHAAGLALKHRELAEKLEEGVYDTGAREDLKHRYTLLRRDLRRLTALAADLHPPAAPPNLSFSFDAPNADALPSASNEIRTRDNLLEQLSGPPLRPRLAQALGEEFVLVDPGRRELNRLLVNLPADGQEQWKTRLKKARGHYMKGERALGHLHLLQFCLGIQSQMNRLENDYYTLLEKGRFTEAKRMVTPEGPLPLLAVRFLVPALETLHRASQTNSREIEKNADRALEPVGPATP